MLPLLSGARTQCDAHAQRQGVSPDFRSPHERRRSEISPDAPLRSLLPPASPPPTHPLEPEVLLPTPP